MAASKIAITIEDKLLKRLDNLVSSQVFPNRSKAIQEAVEEKLMRAADSPGPLCGNRGRFDFRTSPDPHRSRCMGFRRHGAACRRVLHRRLSLLPENARWRRQGPDVAGRGAYPLHRRFARKRDSNPPARDHLCV